MSKDRKEVIDQLSFDLVSDLRANKLQESASTRGNVVTFIDSGTLAIRKEAIRRVEKSGIFTLRKVE